MMTLIMIIRAHRNKPTVYPVTPCLASHNRMRRFPTTDRDQRCKTGYNSV
jgi:hypothetical protein